MFLNFYFTPGPFREYNLSDCLLRIHQVAEAYLIRRMESAYNGELFEPYFTCTIEYSLRPETAWQYLQSRPALKVRVRDFQLSELFQFLYLPLRLQNRLEEPETAPLRRQLEAWLDTIGKDAGRQLHKFDYQRFFDDTMRLDRDELLAGLGLYLPAKQQRRRRPPGTGQRGPVPQIESLNQIATVIQSAGACWTERRQLHKLAAELDANAVPVPARWASLSPPATSWAAAAASHPSRVVKILKYRLAAREKVLARLRG